MKKQDVFIYSGDLRRGDDLEFIKFVSKEKKFDSLLLILVTLGGNPDAAYKIGKYLQLRYDDLTIFVSGLCKSAGTLLAIAAKQIIFSPYGELGPLDVQMTKTDNLAQLDSGLNISEAFLTLEKRAKETFYSLIEEIIIKSGGVVSYHSASHSAAEILGALYGPIFRQIDPGEVGTRARAQRIGEDYGKRLDEKFNNLKPKALKRLSETYSSHGFVIDKDEADLLFMRVDDAKGRDQEFVEELEDICRFPPRKLIMRNVTEQYYHSPSSEKNDGKKSKETTNTEIKRSRKKSKVNGENSVRARTA